VPASTTALGRIVPQAVSGKAVDEGISGLS
jgi:hypothetical protein